MIPLRVWLQQKQIYKKHIKNDYDVEIAFLEGAITRIFSTKNQKTTKIAWIHNDYVSAGYSAECDFPHLKNMDAIVNNISPTAEIIKIIKPIYNFKAAE